MKVLLVIDRFDYKSNADKYIEMFKEKSINVSLLFTRYEDFLIRYIRNIPLIGNFFLHILRWLRSLCYAVRIWFNSDIDVLICLNPIVGIILGCLPEHKRIKKIVCGFLFEEKSNHLYYTIRKKITKHALHNIDKVVVYGSSEVKYYEKLFNLDNKFMFIPYGIDYNTSDKYVNQELPNKYIFSGGGSNRDYKTLIQSYNSLSSCVPLVIATRPWMLSSLEISNCLVLSDVVNETFGDVLKRSSLLVLSLKQCDVSAGHMVLLQAMKLGVPIVVNDIPAIRDYVDESLVTFFSTGNTYQLSNILNKMIESKPDQTKKLLCQKTYQTKYTFDAFLQRIIKYII